MDRYAAVVLAGGAARRMGGADKSAVPVGGRPMRDRVLAAVSDAVPRVLVGPAGDLPPGVLVTREDPAGGGPVAATDAGLALLDPGLDTVALFAADLPLLDSAAVGALRRALDESGLDGACYLDDRGRRQFLCGVWRHAALRSALSRCRDRRGGSLSGAAVRDLLSGLRVTEVSWTGAGAPPWFDCDTDDDVRRAEEWSR
jgi:molybdopterin-guanine dinucleotide biosynthesis protein A